MPCRQCSMFVALAAVGAARVAASNWAGSNCVDAHTLAAHDRVTLLRGMRDAGQKAVRIFIKHDKIVDDLEDKVVGSYNDTILTMVDRFMYEASQHSIKLDIALHSRWALGCRHEDAYVQKYHLPSGLPGCNLTANQPDTFYTDAGAQADFDRRLLHCLLHRNPLMGNRTWGQIPEAVLSIAPQNEPLGHMVHRNYEWLCRRVAVMRPHIAKGILIGTGGSDDLPSALAHTIYTCQGLDVIDVHTYDPNIDAGRSLLQQVVSKARQHGKRARIQEFGTEGNDTHKAAIYDKMMGVFVELGIPFMPWQLSPSPSRPTLAAFWFGSQTWAKIANQSRAVLSTEGAFAWPEVSSQPETIVMNETIVINV